MANIPACSVQWTALHLAVHQGHHALVQKLLQTTPDHEGSSSLAVVSLMNAKLSPLLVAAHRENLELCKLLLLCRAPLPGLTPMGDVGSNETGQSATHSHRLIQQLSPYHATQLGLLLEHRLLYCAARTAYLG